MPLRELLKVRVMVIVRFNLEPYFHIPKALPLIFARTASTRLARVATIRLRRLKQIPFFSIAIADTATFG